MDMKKPEPYNLIIGAIMVCVCVILSGSIGAQAESSPVPGMIAPMRQDALKVPDCAGNSKDGSANYRSAIARVRRLDAFSAVRARRCGWKWV